MNTDIRAVLLQVISDQQPKDPRDGGNLQSTSILNETSARLDSSRGIASEQAILTAFHDLFRTGYLAWGFNLGNPSPPFLHVTDLGRRALANLSRDPANPDGYLNHLRSLADVNPVAFSYLEEGLACFVADLPKAAAVMVGASAESLIIELRDSIVQRMTELDRAVPKGINDWKIKTILDSVFKFIDASKASLPRELREKFEAYWPAFTQQIRATRNEAGHPSSVDPITIDTVHASMLIYPELARLIQDLRDWTNNDLV